MLSLVNQLVARAARLTLAMQDAALDCFAGADPLSARLGEPVSLEALPV